MLKNAKMKNIATVDFGENLKEGNFILYLKNGYNPPSFARLINPVEKTSPIKPRGK
jgi:hypothetical protein